MPALKYKDSFCKTAEQVLANGESLAAICAEIGITRSTLYLWRDTYPEFKESIEIGLQRAQRAWERIGKDGIEGNYEKFNGAPWIFTMKNRFRDDYSEEKESKSVNETLVDKLLDRLVD